MDSLLAYFVSFYRILFYEVIVRHVVVDCLGYRLIEDSVVSASTYLELPTLQLLEFFVKLHQFLFLLNNLLMADDLISGDFVFF